MFFKNEEEYNEYLIKNGISEIEDNGSINYFDWDNEGHVLIDIKKCKESCIDVDNYYFCKGWIMLPDKKTMGLLKNPYGDIQRDVTKDQYDVSLYNNLLIPQIAIQAQNRTAKYYLAKLKKNNKIDKRTYIFTLDFKHQDEEIIHGEEILENMQENINELDIQKLIEITKKYLQKNGHNNQDIEDFEQDFIKQSFLFRFIKHEDQHNKNWAILHNEKNGRIRIAPVYDIDCSCDLNKKNKKMRKTKDGSLVSIESFINQYKTEEWFREYIEKFIEKFDIKKAIHDMKEETSVEMSEKVQTHYMNFFGQRFMELKQAYQKIYSEKDLQENSYVL